MSTPNLPPILPQATLHNAPPGKSFARQAATFSVLAPAVAVGLSIFIQPQVRGDRLAMMIVALASMSLIVLGCVFGIVALVIAKRRGEQGVSGRAAAGTIISGLLILMTLLSIPGLMRARERAKERQQMEQRR